MSTTASGPVQDGAPSPAPTPLSRPAPSPAQVAHRVEFGKVWGAVGAEYRRDRLAAGR